MRGRHPHEVFVEEAEQLDNVFSFRLASKYIVVLNGFDAVHEALVKNADTCSGRVVEFNKFMRVDGEERGKVMKDMLLTFLCLILYMITYSVNENKCVFATEY